METTKVNVSTSCSACSNVAICKFSEEYTNYTNSLVDSTFCEVATIDVRCKYFKSDEHIRKAPTTAITGRDVNYRPSGIAITHTKRNAEISAGDVI